MSPDALKKWGSLTVPEQAYARQLAGPKLSDAKSREAMQAHTGLAPHSAEAQGALIKIASSVREKLGLNSLGPRKLVPNGMVNGQQSRKLESHAEQAKGALKALGIKKDTPLLASAHATPVHPFTNGGGGNSAPATSPGHTSAGVMTKGTTAADDYNRDEEGRFAPG